MGKIIAEGQKRDGEMWNIPMPGELMIRIPGNLIYNTQNIMELSSIEEDGVP